MADDINNPQNEQDNEQEYTYPDAHSQEFGATPHSGGTETLMSLVQNKRLLSVVGGVIGLYILISLLSSDDAEEEAFVDQEAAVVATDIDDISFADFEPSTATPAVSIFDSMDQVAEDKQKQDADFEKVQTQVSSLTRQLADFRSKVQTLDNKVDGLVTAMNKATRQLSAIAETQESQAEKAPEVILQEYKVRAVISGRAWIEDKAGNNITVKVGDNIPTYGRVTQIKPVEGIVETSSGRVISFTHRDE